MANHYLSGQVSGQPNPAVVPVTIERRPDPAIARFGEGQRRVQDGRPGSTDRLTCARNLHPSSV